MKRAIPGLKATKETRGAKGDKGDPGPQGATGATGDRGPAGPTGERGLKGDVGPRGDQGERGSKGDPGTFPDYTDRIDFFSDKRLNIIAYPNIAAFPSGIVGPTTFGLELNGTLRALRLMTNVLTMLGSPINNVGKPEVGSDAATKSYVDDELSSLYDAVNAQVNSTVTNKLKFIVATSIDLQNGLINNLRDPVADHHPTTKLYVDALVDEIQTLLGFVPQNPNLNRPTSLNIPVTSVSGLEASNQEQAIMKQKLDTQIADGKETDKMLKTLIRNLTPTAMTDPFVFVGDHITFMVKQWIDFKGELQSSLAYHIDPVAAKFFSPNLTIDNTVREITPYNSPNWPWTTVYYTLESMISLEYVPYRNERHPLDTNARRYEMLRQFTRAGYYGELNGIPRIWKYISTPNIQIEFPDPPSPTNPPTNPPVTEIT